MSEATMEDNSEDIVVGEDDGEGEGNAQFDTQDNTAELEEKRSQFMEEVKKVEEEEKGAKKSAGQKKSKTLFERVVRHCSMGVIRCDMVGQVGTAESLVVDGMALLQWATKQVIRSGGGWKEDIPALLSVVVVSERLIQALVDLGIGVHVVFFDNHPMLHPQTSSYSAQLLLCHQFRIHFLALDGDKVSVKSFPSWRVPEFARYCEDNICGVVLGSDDSLFGQHLLLHLFLYHDMMCFTMESTYIEGGRVFAVSLCLRQDTEEITTAMKKQLAKLVESTTTTSDGQHLRPSWRYNRTTEASKAAMTDLCRPALRNAFDATAPHTLVTHRILDAYADAIADLSLEKRVAFVRAHRDVSLGEKEVTRFLAVFAENLVRFFTSSSGTEISPITLEIFDHRLFRAAVAVAGQIPSSSITTTNTIALSPLLIPPGGLVEKCVPPEVQKRFGSYIQRPPPQKQAQQQEKEQGKKEETSSASKPKEEVSWDDDDFDPDSVAAAATATATATAAATATQTMPTPRPEVNASSSSPFQDILHWHRMDPLDKEVIYGENGLSIRPPPYQCQAPSCKSNEAWYTYVHKWPLGGQFCVLHKTMRMMDVRSDRMKQDFTRLLEQKAARTFKKYVDSLVDHARTVTIPQSANTAVVATALTKAAINIIIPNVLKLMKEELQVLTEKLESTALTEDGKRGEALRMAQLLSDEDDYLAQKNVHASVVAPLRENATYKENRKALFQLIHSRMTGIVQQQQTSDHLVTFVTLRIWHRLCREFPPEKGAGVINTQIEQLSKAHNVPTFYHYQLLHAGADLARPSGVRDQRACGFRPDAWQVKVLDAIDKEKSMLVVAPTSSGKTFMCLYAMEKVMRKHSQGICVYVSPTKALAIQMRAEVDAKFSGRQCLIFTRDFRVDGNIENAHVLVVVPACLEILMFSLFRLGWLERIRYVIFDEIHTIGDEHNGATWLRLLMMTQAPFLGLSATIGDASRFAQWLGNVAANKRKPMEFECIEHHSRYNNLRLFIRDGASLEDKNEITAFNPLSFANIKIAHEAKKFPSDLKLLPEHLVAVYETIASVVPEVERLSPANFFASRASSAPNSGSTASQFLTTSDVEAYEEELKKFLVNLPEPQLAQVVALIRKNDPGFHVAERMHPYPRGHPCSVMIPLAKELRGRDMLPSLCFTNDQRFIEMSGKMLYDRLEDEERVWRETCMVTDPEEGRVTVNRKIALLKERIEAIANIPPPRPGNKNNENLAEQLSNMVQNLKEYQSELRRLAGPQRQFSMPGKANPITKEEICEEAHVRANGKVEYYWLFLLRGIGIHHASLPKRYRQTVEQMLRRHQLGIVFSTATLATGINVPCRTAVLAYDSVYLTPLSWRQMGGRAGRRGFDKVGNVVFVGVPQSKMVRLINSGSSILRGHQVITPSYMIRQLVRYQGEVEHVKSGAKPSILIENEYPLVWRVRSLITTNINPSLSDPVQWVAQELLFSQDFLIRRKIFGEDGAVTPSAALCSHLFYTEPACLLLVAMMQNLLFTSHIFGDEVGRDPRDGTPVSARIQKNLVIVYANIFYTRPLLHLDEQILRPDSTRAGVVVLPRLPALFRDCMIDYRRDVLSSALRYAGLCRATTGESTKTETLPLSRLSYASDATGPVRSVLCQMSGLTDEDYPRDDLANFQVTLSSAISFNGDFLPKIEIQPSSADQEEGELRLNAYAYDFYTHGSRTALQEENGIRRSDHYEVLNNFRLLLQALAASFSRERQWLQAQQRERDDYLRQLEHLAFHTSCIARFFKQRLRDAGLLSE